MLKLLGAALLTAGTAAAGYSAAARLGRRVESLRAWISALELLERELSFRLTPIPDLLDELSRRAPPPCDGFFARCHESLERLGEKSFGELWLELLDSCPMDLDAQDRAALAALGQVLGRYDGDGQCEAAALARRRLEGELAPAAEARSVKGRLYTVLGLSAGCLVVILLL